MTNASGVDTIDHRILQRVEDRKRRLDHSWLTSDRNAAAFHVNGQHATANGGPDRVQRFHLKGKWEKKHEENGDGRVLRGKCDGGNKAIWDGAKVEFDWG